MNAEVDALGRMLVKLCHHSIIATYKGGEPYNKDACIKHSVLEGSGPVVFPAYTLRSQNSLLNAVSPGT